jgi:hypothetical protein
MYEECIRRWTKDHVQRKINIQNETDDKIELEKE